MKVLLMGSGSSSDRRVKEPGQTDFSWQEGTFLVRTDYEERHKPGVVVDFNHHPLPFLDESFDEIHAYEVLEHLGRQGDWKFFFAEFAEYWRILKPGGKMFVMCPSYQSMWAWGDPSHTRVITYGTLYFLSQKEYAKQVGKTAMSDFRSTWKRDFDVLWTLDDGINMAAILQKA